MKKLTTLCILALISACLITTACRKSVRYQDVIPDQRQATATVLNTGDPNADGCGWLIKIDDVTYSPDNLSSYFKINNIQVKIKYTISDADYSCGWGAKMKYIHLYDIRR
jgi:hypothetical protein